MQTVKENPTKQTEKAYSNISLRSFLTVTGLLLAVLIFCGSLSYFVPQGAFLRDSADNIIPDTYEKGSVHGIAFWRVLTAPFRVFASEDIIVLIFHTKL